MYTNTHAHAHPQTRIHKHTCATGDNWEPVRLTNNRPFMVKTKGEVFFKHNPEPDYDLVLFRALEAVGGTATAHFLQGVTLWYSKGEPAKGKYD